MRKIVLPVFILVLMLSFVFPVNGAKKETAPQAKAFPNFIVTTLDGTEVSLYSNYKDKGKIIILDLFATWCPPCKMEIPSFIELQERYKDKLVVVGLSFDQKGPDIVTKFAAELKINYDLYMGTSEIANAVQLSGIPRTFILYPDFRIEKDLTGFHPMKEFEDTVNRMALSMTGKKKKSSPKK